MRDHHFYFLMWYPLKVGFLQQPTEGFLSYVQYIGVSLTILLKAFTKGTFGNTAFLKYWCSRLLNPC